MYCDDPLIEPADDCLVAWVGDLNQQELDAYLKESGAKGMDEPNSRFSSELGRWYDHKLVYASAVDEPAPIRSIAQQVWFDDDLLLVELEERYSLETNCFILLWNFRLLKSLKRLGQELHGGLVKCIGSWRHMPYQ